MMASRAPFPAWRRTAAGMAPLLFVLGLAACAAPAPPLTIAAAEAAGMDGAALDEAVALFRDAVDSDELRGTVLLVARNGHVVVYEAVGWRDKEKGRSMQRNALFRMASNTKPVIATAILMLAEEGRLSLDDPVGRFIPGFAKGELSEITIEHLLTHTSGLPRGPIFLRGVEPDSDLTRESERFAEALELVAEPGAEYGYSNVGYNVLGGVIEAASGQRLTAFLQDRIYRPLGMHDSGNHESAADHSRMSKVYRRGSNGEWRASWSPGDEPDFPIPRASGGMISTAWDYAVFLQTWLNGGRFGNTRVLSEESVARAIAPVSREITGEAGPGGGYGYGWQVSADGRFSHSGSDGTFAWVEPELGIFGIVFTQSLGGSNPRNEFVRRVRAAVAQPVEVAS